MQYIYDMKFGMLQVRENEISLRKKFDGATLQRALLLRTIFPYRINNFVFKKLFFRQFVIFV